MPDFPTQLRASTDLVQDLKAAGEYPSDGQGSGGTPINVLIVTSDNLRSPEVLRQYQADMEKATGQRVLTVESSEGE
jgi:hypothetical protein